MNIFDALFFPTKEQIANRFISIDIERDNKRRQLARVEAWLRQSTQMFLDTGIAVIDEPAEENAVQWLAGDTQRMRLRAAAKEMGRPFILAVMNKNARKWLPGRAINKNYTHLIIPHNKRLAGLASALLIVAPEVKSEDHFIFDPLAPALRVNTPLQWHFYFQGQDGIELFNAFLDQCRTDPVFRVMLKT